MKAITLEEFLKSVQSEIGHGRLQPYNNMVKLLNKYFEKFTNFLLPMGKVHFISNSYFIDTSEEKTLLSKKDITFLSKKDIFKLLLVQAKYLKELQADSEFLNCLQSLGVDNWTGYEDAIDMYQDKFGDD